MKLRRLKCGIKIGTSLKLTRDGCSLLQALHTFDSRELVAQHLLCNECSHCCFSQCYLPISDNEIVKVWRAGCSDSSQRVRAVPIQILIDFDDLFQSSDTDWLIRLIGLISWAWGWCSAVTCCVGEFACFFLVDWFLRSAFCVLSVSFFVSQTTLLFIDTYWLSDTRIQIQQKERRNERHSRETYSANYR